MSIEPQARPARFAVQSESPPEKRTLRLSVTDRCNYRCRYCMPASGVPLAHHDDLPALEELSEAIEWLAGECGVCRVKLTGGEPLVRPGIDALIRQIASIPEIEEISMTTNGALLARNAGPLARAGLQRVNISLDSLDPARFAALTRDGELADVLEGIEAALRAGLTPLKLNAVLKRNGWREDVPLLLDFAAARGIEIRFIELMHTGTERGWVEDEFVSAEEVRGWLVDRARVLPRSFAYSGPARRMLVNWRGKAVRIGWITPLSHPFCDSCNRLRLDSLGRLRRCLIDPQSLPLVTLLKAGNSRTVRRRVAEYLDGKRPPRAMATPLTMSALGG